MLVLMFICRGMDFLSTWVATPNLVLEGNPIAKKLGWKWGVVLNCVVCFGLAFWPVSSIAISTASILVASRNFQSAWLMRTLGEHNYRDWHVERIHETPVLLFLFCLFGQTVLVFCLGGAVVYFSNQLLVPFAVGIGIISYAIIVAFYTSLSLWRIHRNRTPLN